MYLRSDAQSTVPVQPAPNVSPFGALPTMARLSIGQAGSTSPVQYGISSMPVSVQFLNLPLQATTECF